jgi:hypothetical protein
MRKTDQWWRGWFDYEENRRFSDNPYPDGSPAANDWERGWLASEQNTI